MNQNRTRPAKLVTLAPETWERLDKMARRTGTSRSGMLERLIRDAEMPRTPRVKLETDAS